jgi:hypothetical protein
MKKNISGPIAISRISSIAPGSMKDSTLWADIATAMKIDSTEILTFKIKLSRNHQPFSFSRKTAIGLPLINHRASPRRSRVRGLSGLSYRSGNPAPLRLQAQA